jgi:hypothetical protein
MIGPVVIVTLPVFTSRFDKYDGRDLTKALVWMVLFEKAQSSANVKMVQLTVVASGGGCGDSV